MAFVDRGRTGGRVRVTERIMAPRDARGYSRVIAAAGEVLTLREAWRRGIPEDRLEPVGHAGRVALAELAGGPVDRAAVDRAEQAARAAEAQERAAQRDAAPPRRSGGGQFPAPRGGGWFELSDGRRVRGEEEARAAQATLDEQSGDGGSPDG